MHYPRHFALACLNFGIYNETLSYVHVQKTPLQLRFSNAIIVYWNASLRFEMFSYQRPGWE